MTTGKRGVTGTPEFKNWFGQSKVVDKDGEPEIDHPTTLFHGTTHEFSEFDEDLIGTGGGLHVGEGFYFSDNKEIAESFAKGEEGRIIDAYLKVEKPFDLDQDFDVSEVKRIGMLDAGKHDLFWDEEYFEDVDGSSSNGKISGHKTRDLMNLHFGEENVNSHIKMAGYDGITHKSLDEYGEIRVSEDEPDMGRVWIAFTPTQIKSASKNEGEFDPDNPNAT